MKFLVKADSRYPIDRKKIRLAVENLLNEHKISSDVELSLYLVGERKIKELKKKYLGIDEVTDVLSFGQDPPSPKASEGQTPLILGDVVVCYPQAKRQALRFNRLLDDEIEFLVCHGVLHLLGIHHD